MRLVPQLVANSAARECAVIPNKTTDPEGFIDTGRVLTGWDQPVAVSVTAIRAMGQMVGLVSHDRVKELEHRLAEQNRRIEELQNLVSALTVIEETTKEKVAA